MVSSMGIEKLSRFINNENLVEYKDYTLSNIISLLEQFGNPHQMIRCIHIAGTNGKGSTAYMLNSILINSGYTTGLFISPHLIRINERMQINNREIDDSALDRYIDDILQCLERNKNITPTYFDIITLIGFLFFRDNKADVAVIETGLGGRLDSTNVITPLCSVITDISLDHIYILGDSLEAIVAEKSGIIKPGIPCVTSNSGGAAEKILSKKCREMNSDIFIYEKDYHTGNIRHIDDGYDYDYTLNTGSGQTIIRDIRLNLRGIFQIRNSSMVITAILAIQKYFPGITIESIKKGLSHLKIPGRFQVLSLNPTIIFDPAHNTGAIEAILGIIDERYRGRNIFYILTLMKDKEYDKILSMILDRGSNIVYYELDDSRAYKPSIDMGKHRIQTIVKDRKDIVKFVHDNNKSDAVFIFTGSFRLYETALDCAQGKTDS